MSYSTEDTEVGISSADHQGFAALCGLIQRGRRFADRVTVGYRVEALVFL